MTWPQLTEHAGKVAKADDRAAAARTSPAEPDAPAKDQKAAHKQNSSKAVKAGADAATARGSKGQAVDEAGEALKGESLPEPCMLDVQIIAADGTPSCKGYQAARSEAGGSVFMS